MAGDGFLHGGRIEHVDLDRRRSKRAEERRLLVGARHARDVVAGGDQLPNRPLAQHAGRTGNEHLHERTSWRKAAPFMTASVGTLVASFASRSATVVRRSSARHASSARYMASAMAHTGE